MVGRPSIVTGIRRGRRRFATRVVAATMLLTAAALLLPAAAGAYTPGKQVWAKTYGTAARPAACLAVASASNGAVCMKGWTKGASGTDDVFVAKYGLNGHLQWARTYRGALDSPQDGGRAIAVDSKGMVYVGGVLAAAGGGLDLVLLKYSAAGSRMWARKYHAPVSASRYTVHLALDAGGNAYLTTNKEAAGGLTGLVVLKYDSAGHQKWVYTREPDPSFPQSGSVSVAGIALDAKRNVYVCGAAVFAGIDQALTVKLDTNGHKQWAQVWNDADGDPASADAIAVRGTHIVVAGLTHTSGGSSTDALVLSYGPNGGDPQHVFTTHDATGSAGCDSVALDARSNVYVTGYTGVSSCLTVKLDSDLSQKWLKAEGGTGAGNALVLDAAGAAYVAGSMAGARGDQFLTLKYTSGGTRVWTKSWAGPGNRDNGPSGITLSGTSAVYVGGVGAGSPSFIEAALIRYNR